MLDSKEIVHAIHKRMIDLQMVMSDACEYLADLDESDDMVMIYSTRYNEAYERYRELRALLNEITGEDDMLDNAQVHYNLMQDHRGDDADVLE